MSVQWRVMFKTRRYCLQRSPDTTLAIRQVSPNQFPMSWRPASRLLPGCVSHGARRWDMRSLTKRVVAICEKSALTLQDMGCIVEKVDRFFEDDPAPLWTAAFSAGG